MAPKPPKPAGKPKKTLHSKAATPSQAELTEVNLNRHNELVENLKAGKITEDQISQQMENDPAGAQKLWKKFEYRRNQQSTEVKHGWDEICGMGRGQGQQHKKKMLLFAWLKDEKFGQGYISVMQSISMKRTNIRELTWLTWKELTDKHGADEAHGLVQSGAVLARPHPKDKRYWQFLSQTDTLSLTMEQKKELAGTTTGKATSKQIADLGQACSMELDDQTWQDLWDGDAPAGMDWKDLKALKDTEDDDEDEGAESHLPPELQKHLGIQFREKGKNPKDKEAKDPKEPKESTIDKRLDSITQMGDDDDTKKAMNKVSMMHSLLCKLLQNIKITNKSMGKSSQHREAGEKAMQAADKVNKQIQVVDKMLLSKSSVPSIKKSLVVAAKVAKEGNESINMMKGVIKGK